MPALISTTTPLNANQVFTSSVYTLTRASAITGTIFADEPGTFYLDWSGDGVNFDFSNSTAITANAGQSVDFEVIAQFFRVRYVNGTTTQTVFRLYINAQDIYGAFLAAASGPSAGGAYAVLYLDPNTNQYVYVGRFDGLDGFNANGNAAIATNRSGKYASFLVSNAVTSDESLTVFSQHVADNF